MKKWLMAVMFGAVLVLGACGGGDDGASEEPAEETGGETADAGEAEDIYKNSCASCHGGDLEGGAGPDLTSVGSDLSQEEIETVIEEGQGSMPAGLVSGDDLTTLAGWLSEQK